MRFEEGQRGQALVLIAVAFIGLIAFIGLAVDAGILFTQVGHLRRGVDAAALGAANQYRKDTTAAQLEAAVDEFLQVNNLDPSAASAIDVRVCNLTAYPPDLSSLHDDSLCKENNPWDYDRKLIEVTVAYPVEFVFLPIVGFDTVDIRATAHGEAASVDLVLVLDTSTSMDEDSNPDACNPTDTCQPFEEVRSAALGFVEQLYFPYDHVGIVHFDAVGYKPEDTGEYPAGVFLTDDKSVADDAIYSLEVYKQQPCSTLPDPGGCLSTNVQEGLIQAADALFNDGRDESLWVVVVLTDGAANQARYDLDGDGAIGNDEWLCPNPTANGSEPTWIQPYCRDGDASFFGSGRHAEGDTWYDVEDITKDAADILGCLDTSNPAYAGSWCDSAGVTNGYEALIYTIGMGDQVISTACDTYYDSNPPCDGDMGERLLRYIAAVGDDGNPTTDPCEFEASGSDCGNYFYAPDAGDLDEIFATIANRIYTRITK